MHELSICQALIEQVEAVAREHDAHSVRSIVLHVGPLSGVVPELLERSFSVVQTGTIAEHARLTIESLPVLVNCSECGAETTATSNRIVCGACGDWRVHVVTGDELLLASIEVERDTLH